MFLTTAALRHCLPRISGPFSTFLSLSFSTTHTLKTDNPAPIRTAGAQVNLEALKKSAAYLAVVENFPPSAQYIGIGSSPIISHVVSAILALPLSFNAAATTFILTGHQSQQLLHSAGLRVGSLETAPTLEVVFDGADEIDSHRYFIKGGGAYLLQEKLMAMKAQKFVVIADYTAVSHSLSARRTRGIPIEVFPSAASYVLERLVALGSKDPTLRLGEPADMGPCLTDNGNFVIDAPFPDGFSGPTCQGNLPGRKSRKRRLVEAVGTAAEKTAMGIGGSKSKADNLSELLNNVVGVVEHGLFSGVDRAADLVYIGGKTGEVSVRGKPKRQTKEEAAREEAKRQLLEHSNEAGVEKVETSGEAEKESKEEPNTLWGRLLGRATK